MNTTSTLETRHAAPARPATVPLRARRLTLLDRAALHLGVALIRWGRRPGREAARFERRATSYERRLALAHREAAVQRYEAARTSAILTSNR